MQPLPLKHARRRLEAYRDENGVPHVVASSWRAALYGLGYLHGLDRPTQMLFARALASGRSAERIADKPELLETDRFFRRVGLHLLLDDEVRRLDDRTFGDITAYCEGVNDGLHESGRSLPMWATGFRPDPWNQQAVLLIGNLLSYGGLAVGQQQNERLLLELIQTGIDDTRLRELFSPLLDQVNLELLRRVRMTSQLSDDAIELLTDLPRLAGSNAWAVSPGRSATGHALLAADPHLEVNRLPAIWYEAVLKWDGQYVMGATLPGCPLFGVGRTGQLAWGVTYMKADTIDYFIEDCRPGGTTGWQYRRGQEWRDFQLRPEVIQRKSGAPETLKVYSNPQGILESDPGSAGAGYYLTFSWIGNGIGSSRSIATWLDLIGCPSAADAMEVARECPQPTLCWMFADKHGHIGMQGGGWIPKRNPVNSGLLPVPAWDEANHWRGRLENYYLPHIYDPPEGFIASANENINSPGDPPLVTMPVPDYRKRRLVERLRGLPKATLKDMQQLQYDVVSTQARELLGIFLQHLPEGPLKNRLAAWNYSYDPASLEATLFAKLYRNVLLEIFGEAPHREGGGIGWRRMLYLSSRFGFSMMVLTCIDRLLKENTSRWWSGRDKGELIRRAAEKIADEPDMPWGEFNSFHFVNRFIGNRRMGRYFGFDTRQMAMPGCHATPFQGHLLTTAKRETTFAPSYHFVTDLGVDEAWTNLPGGPSESRFSPFYKSDINRWQSGTYKRLALREETGVKSQESGGNRRRAEGGA
ncbi:MAG TPA: penicillin acylase family protein [Pirellulales bacterium]